jgi:hypothetical protein
MIGSAQAAYSNSHVQEIPSGTAGMGSAVGTGSGAGRGHGRRQRGRYPQRQPFVGRAGNEPVDREGHAEGLMRPVGVVLIPEGVDRRLRGRDVQARPAV